MSAYRLVTNIADFSDDILLHIFSFLNSWDLLQVTETCHRLNKVGKDHSLWRKADFSDGCLSASQIARRALSCVQTCTKHLHFKGRKKRLTSKNKWKSDLLTPHLMKTIAKKCPEVEELFLSEAVVNAKNLKLIHLGEVKNLKVLCISDCEFINLPSPVLEGSYFRSMNSIFPKIESLEISSCNWITDYDLMVLSKLDSLKKLCLKCDLRIGFTIAYLSISFRFGFKNLEELDIRGTSLQNSDVHPIIQGGKLKSLFIGPIGRVKRFSDKVDDDGLNLIISDPFRREEPKQQVVVINMGPNGPHWRQAEEEELDNMGLQWVRNGLNRYREAAVKEEEHYFFCKEGKILKEKPENKVGECSQNLDNDKKRKHDDDSVDESSSKRTKPKIDNESDCDEFNSEEEEDEEDGEGEAGEETKSSKENPSFVTEESTMPDESLSDIMVHAFKDYSKDLQHLVVAGCAITNVGLRELIRYTPSLKYLDVTSTHVTGEGIQEAQLLLPNCRFIIDTKISQNGR